MVTLMTGIQIEILVGNVNRVQVQKRGWGGDDIQRQRLMCTQRTTDPKNWVNLLRIKRQEKVQRQHLGKFSLEGE